MKVHDYITLFSDLGRYLYRIHSRNRYFRIVPGRIRRNRRGEWRVVGKTDTRGTRRRDIQYLGATVHYLITGENPRVDCLLDGFSPFSDRVRSSYPARFLGIVMKTLILTGEPGSYGDEDLRRDIGVLEEELRIVEGSLALSGEVPDGFRFTRDRWAVSASGDYDALKRYHRVMWLRRTPGSVLATPYVHGTNIFIVTKDGIIGSYDRRTGESMWVTRLETSIESSPVLGGGNLYFGSDAGTLYGIDMLTGTLKHERSLGNRMIRSSPLALGNRLLIGTGSGSMHCLGLPGLHSIWSYETGGSIYSSAETDGKTVWVGSDDGYIYAFSLEQGELKWKFETGERIRSSPAYAGGKVVVGSFDGNLYALRANNGKLVWKSKTGDRIFSSPVGAAGKVCVGSNDGKLYLFNESDGSLVWRRSTGKPVASSPLVLSKTIFAGSDDGYLYGFDIATGRRIMRRRLGTRFRSSPVWLDGNLYYAGNEHFGCSLVKGV